MRRFFHLATHDVTDESPFEIRTSRVFFVYHFRVTFPYHLWDVRWDVRWEVDNMVPFWNS